MARNNLCRLVASSLSNLSIRSESVMSRTISLSTYHRQQQQQQSQEILENKEKEGMEENTESESKENQADDDDVDVNKETGEIGGPRGPEPTRYGDWERNGRCYDF